MPTEIKLPELGENIDSATVTRVLVKVGQAIKKDQPIMELDTEKASVDVPASAAGTVQEIRVKEGDVLKVGQVVLVLNGSGEAAAPAETEKPKQEAKPAAERPKPEPPPKEQEPKPKPKPQPEPVESSEEETEPSEPEAEAPSHPPSTPSPQVSDEELPEPSHEGVPAAPSLRRMARELGIDIRAVVGTGPNGWITREDVRNYARSIILNSTVAGTAGKPAALPDFSRWGAVERKATSNIRRVIADHLQDAWTSIPHVTLFDVADITELEKYRQEISKKAREGQARITITAIAVKIVAAALKVFPQFNVSLDQDRGELIQKKYYNIGVAVDTEHGLLVPVIRNVDTLNIIEISNELASVADKARSRKLSLEEMQGGSFTITNLGGVGGVGFTPIINSPEVAILGLSRSSIQPVFRDGEFKPRLMLPLSVSMDHRVIDGAEAARFLRWISEAFEQPLKLLIEG